MFVHLLLPPCSWAKDKWGVKTVLETWPQQYKLESLPIFALGISAGASFALKLPKITRINGIISGARGGAGAAGVLCKIDNARGYIVPGDMLFWKGPA